MAPAQGTVRIIGASPEAGATWVARLADAGYAIDRERVAGPEDLKRLGREPPSAVVIDLDRAPARGRDIALALRQRVATRRIPIVLVASDRAVFERLKALPLETMQAAPEDVVTAVASALSMPPSGSAAARPADRRLLRHPAAAEARHQGGVARGAGAAAGGLRRLCCSRCRRTWCCGRRTAARATSPSGSPGPGASSSAGRRG